MPLRGGWRNVVAVITNSTVTEWILAYSARIWKKRLMTSVTKRPRMKIIICVMLNVPPMSWVPKSITYVCRYSTGMPRPVEWMMLREGGCRCGWHCGCNRRGCCGNVRCGVMVG